MSSRAGAQNQVVVIGEVNQIKFIVCLCMCLDTC